MPIDRTKLPEQISTDYCDIVMAGVAVTTDRASEILFSSAYMDETVGLLVPYHARQQFTTWDNVRELGTITIAVPDVPYFLARLHELCLLYTSPSPRD